MQASKIRLGKLVRALICVLLLVASVGFYGVMSGLNTAKSGVVADVPPATIPNTTWLSLYDFTGYGLEARDPTEALGAKGSENNPYLIQNAKDLTYLSYASRLAVNASFAGVYFAQSADIQLENYLWTPIGNSTYRFAGTYTSDYNGIDGNYKIKNMCVYQNQGSYIGLFSFLSSATIDGVVFEDAYVKSGAVNVTYGVYAGMIAGHATNSYFKNIITDGLVEVPSYYIGGLVGVATTTAEALLGSFIDCTNNAEIRGEQRTGGIVGQSSGYNFIRCTNNAKITGNIHTTSEAVGVSLSVFVGGLAGFIEGNEPIDVDDCHNNGQIIAQGIDRTTDSVKIRDNVAANYAGGLVGYCVSTRVTINFSDCTNNEVVKASGSVVGGLAGRVDYLTADNCENTAEVLAGTKYYTKNSSGVVDTSVAPTYFGGTEVGGLFGRIYKGIISDSVNTIDGEVSTYGYYVGGIVGAVYNITTIDDCHNYANIRAESAYNAGRGAGGIAGYWASGISRSYVINCTNGEDLVNGELNTVTITGSSTGGAVGYLNNSNITITNFINYGAMEGLGFSYSVAAGVVSNVTTLGQASGFVGYVGGTGSTIVIQGNSKVDPSINYGNMRGVNIGGAIAYVSGASNLTIRNFTNEADIYNVATTGDAFDAAGTPTAMSNVNISDASNLKTSNLGGILGYDASRTTLIDVVNNGNIVTLTAPSGSNSFTAGIAGRMTNSNTRLTDVTNNGHVWVVNANAHGYYVAGVVAESRGEFVRVNNYGTVTTGGAYVGGLVGYFYGTGMTDSHNYAAVTGVEYAIIAGETTTNYTSSYVGGLIGITATGTTIVMDTCSNSATVSGGSVVGGIMGRSSQTLTMRNVINHSTAIVTSTSYYTGGLIGNQSAGNVKIYNSLNEAAVTSTLKTQTVQYATGGLIGSITAVGAKLYIENSTNTGNITGMYAGGIVGCNYIGSLANAEMYKVTNTGNITSPGYNNGTTTFYGGYAGGIVGNYAGSYGALLLKTVTNEGSISGRYVGGIVGNVHTLETHNTINRGQLTCNFVASNTALTGGASGTFATTNTGGIGGIAYNVANIANINTTTNEALTKTSAPVFNILTNLQYAGGLIAVCKNAEIYDSANYADILIDTFNTTATGGLIGFANNSVILNISKSHNNGNISGKLVSNSYGLGGLIGAAYNQVGFAAINGTLVIKNSYVDCSVTNTQTTAITSGVGGLVGFVRGAYNISNNMVYAKVLSANYFVGGVIGYSYIAMDAPNGLDYTVKNCYVEGIIAGAPSSATASSTGGVIGYVYFVNAVNLANKPTAINVNITDTLSTVRFDSIDSGKINTFAINGGLIGRVAFNSHATLASQQNINIKRSFYLFDTTVNASVLYAVASPLPTSVTTTTYPKHANAYVNFTYGGTSPTTVNTGNGTTSSAILTENAKTQLTIANAKLPATYAGWDFTGESSGADKTFWAIADNAVSLFNGNYPFLRNTFSGVLIFDANNGLFNIADGVSLDRTEFSLNSYVGNSVTLTEAIPVPVREYFKFKGWQDAQGNFYTVSGSLVELIDTTMTLEAVWEHEEYYVNFIGGGNIKDATSAIVRNYIAADKVGLYIETTYLPANFARWEIYDAATGLYTDFPYYDTNGIIALSTPLIETLIQTHSFIEDGVKTIRLLQVTTSNTKFVSVDFANETSLNNATVRTWDTGTTKFVNYKIGDMLEVNTGGTSTTILLEISPKAHYNFGAVALYNNATPLVENIDYTRSGNEFTITVSDRMNILINLVKTNYTVNIKQVYNTTDGATITTETLYSGVANGTAVVLGSETLKNFVIETDVPGYRYAGLYVKNTEGKYQGYTPSTINATFLNNYVIGMNIELVIVFVQQYKITVTSKANSTGEGDIGVYRKGAGGVSERIELDDANAAYVDNNETIMLLITPSSRSTFAGIEVGGADFGKTTSVLIDNNKNIAVKFDLSYYQLKLATIDDSGAEITGLENNIEVVMTAENNQSILVGTTINMLAMKNANPDKYSFRGWFVLLNGELFNLDVLGSFAIAGSTHTVTNLTLDENALSDYTGLNSDLTIVAVFDRLFSLNLSTNNSVMGGFKVYIVEGINETLQQAPYQFLAGTIIKVVAEVSNTNYFSFVSLTAGAGIIAGDTVTFMIMSDVPIVAVFVEEEFAFALDTNDASAQGNVTTTATKIAVGSQITISFNIDAGYESTGWFVVDKLGKKHDAKSLSDNIQYTSNSLVLTVDEYWLDNFGTTFKSEVTTMMNSTFFGVLIASGVLIPLLLVAILVFMILNNKKKAAAKAAKKRNQQTEFGFQTDYVQKLRKGEAGAGKDTLKDEQ